MSYPSGMKTRIVTGNYVDTFVLDGQPNTRPTQGYVLITPCIEAIKFNDLLINPEYLESKKFWLTNGAFEAELIVTTQANVDPVGWTYKAEYSWLPTPVYFHVEDSVDPLILSSEYMADPSTGVIIQKGPQGDPGEKGDKGDAGDFEGAAVVDMVQNGSTITVYYSDGTTTELSFSTGGLSTYIHQQSNAAEQWIVNHGLAKHITSVYVTFGTQSATENEDMILCPWQEIDLNTIRIFAASPGAVASGQAIVF